MGGLVCYVDVFIGIGGYGYIYFGVIWLFGMVQFSFDIYDQGWDVCLGYYQGDGLIMGFLYMYLSGIGVSDMFDVLVMLVQGLV